MWIETVSSDLVAAVAKAWKLEGEANLGWVETALLSGLNAHFDCAGQTHVGEWLKQNPHFYVLKPQKLRDGKMFREISLDSNQKWGLRITPEYRLSEDRQSHEIKLRWATKAQANNTLRTEVQNFYATNGAP